MGRRSFIEDVYHHKNNRGPKKISHGVVGGHHDSVAAVGLQILVHRNSKLCDSNIPNCIILKSKLIKPTNSHFHHLLLRPNPNPSSNTKKPHNYFPQYSCFLKSCFLCSKTLSPHKDVYMYRGDQGFCSEECRNRQIYLDEIREIEISTKKLMLASTRKSFHGGGGGGRCEATMLLHEHRHLHKPLPRRHQPIFSYS